MGADTDNPQDGLGDTLLPYDCSGNIQIGGDMHPLVEINNNPPTVDITYPFDGDTVSGTITITGTASDPDGNQDLQKVEVKIDTGGWMLATGKTSWNHNWDTTAFSNGLHTISARSYDGQDYSNIDQVTVTVYNAISSDWPMFHHDLFNTGYSPSTAPDTNNVKWSYRTGHHIHSSPAVTDGKVYIGSYDGKVYCLNAVDGNRIWMYSTGVSIDSSPVVADGKVYIGAQNGEIFCLDAVGNTGGTTNLIWSYTTGGWVQSSPAVADGKVYIASSDEKKIYCLNAADGSFIWSYIVVGFVISSPAVADGKVYIGHLLLQMARYILGQITLITKCIV